ncbi:MAG: ATP-binding protein [Kineosporiaceae bacterium]|jgi:two-component system OmpR family sensor kinase
MRRRLVLAAVLALAAALVPVTAVFYVVLSRTLEADALSVLQARAAAASATVAAGVGPSSAQDPRDEAVLDAVTWVFDRDGRLLERPAHDQAVEAVVLSLARVREPVRRDVGETALLAVPVTADADDAGARRLGTVVAGVSRTPYEDAEADALTAALALDVVVLVAVGLLTRRMVGAALEPVARMTSTAEEWGARDVDKRFALGEPTDELTGLAATLDGLLARLSSSLGHERRLTAEIAHELRTPLARIRADAEVALNGRPSAADLRATLTDIVADTEQLAATIDSLLRSAATDAGGLRQGTTGARCDPWEAARTAARRAGLAADVVDPETTVDVGTAVDPGAAVDLDVAAEEDLVVRALQPVLDNAGRYGEGRIRIRARVEAADLVLDVLDEGPGFTADDCRSALEPGARGSAAAGIAGAGLGLPLARRLARSAGGDVTAHAATPARPGGHVEVRFPLASRPRPDHGTTSAPPRWRIRRHGRRPR